MQGGVSFAEKQRDVIVEWPLISLLVCVVIFPSKLFQSGRLLLECWLFISIALKAGLLTITEQVVAFSIQLLHAYFFE